MCIYIYRYIYIYKISIAWAEQGSSTLSVCLDIIAN